MAKTNYHDLVILSLGIIVLCVFHANSQSPFRFYTLYTNSNYNNSQNLLYNGTTTSISLDFACLLKCKTFKACVIVVLTLKADQTISCRFYRGFFGILNPQSWITYDTSSHLYLRGFI